MSIFGIAFLIMIGVTIAIGILMDHADLHLSNIATRVKEMKNA